MREPVASEYFAREQIPSELVEWELVAREPVASEDFVPEHLLLEQVG